MSKTEEIKCNNIINKRIQTVINFDDYTNENKIEHNSKWPYIPDHPYKILIIGDF